MDKRRIEALSDGVFAVAITLLILDVKLPTTEANSAISSQLHSLAPNIAAYILSFCVIGILWNGHHTIMGMVHAIDRRLIWLNLLYLMIVAFMPFPASVLAAHYNDQASVILYATMLVLVGALHFTLVGYIRSHPKITKKHFSSRFWERSTVSTLFGATCGVLAICTSFVSVRFSLLFLCIMPIYYIFVNRTNDDLVNSQQ